MEILNTSQTIGLFNHKDRKLVKLPNMEFIKWSDIDFLGWIHPSGQLGYIVCEVDGALKGIVFERAVSVNRKPKLCSLCLTMHPGNYVNIFSAKKDKNSMVGQYMCHNLKCSLYVRRKKIPTTSQLAETLNIKERVKRLNDGLEELMRNF